MENVCREDPKGFNVRIHAIAALVVVAAIGIEDQHSFSKESRELHYHYDSVSAVYCSLRRWETFGSLPSKLIAYCVEGGSLLVNSR